MVDVLQEHGHCGHERFFLVHLDEIIPKLLRVCVQACHRTAIAKRFLETVLSDPSFHMIKRTPREAKHLDQSLTG